MCGWLSLTGSGGNSVSENRGGGTRPVVVYALVVTRVGELSSGGTASSSLRDPDSGRKGAAVLCRDLLVAGCRVPGRDAPFPRMSYPGERQPCAETRPPQHTTQVVDSDRRTHNTSGAPSAMRVIRDEGRGFVIILGVILLILGLLLDVYLLWIIGIILAVVGGVLWLLGSMDRKVGPRKHYY